MDDINIMDIIAGNDIHNINVNLMFIHSFTGIMIIIIHIHNLLIIIYLPSGKLT